jgi:hypothetical protein
MEGDVLKTLKLRRVTSSIGASDSDKLAASTLTLTCTGTFKLLSEPNIPEEVSLG